MSFTALILYHPPRAIVRCIATEKINRVVALTKITRCCWQGIFCQTNANAICFNLFTRNTCLHTLHCIILVVPFLANACRFSYLTRVRSRSRLFGTLGAIRRGTFSFFVRVRVDGAFRTLQFTLAVLVIPRLAQFALILFAVLALFFGGGNRCESESEQAKLISVCKQKRKKEKKQQTQYRKEYIKL